LVEQLVDANERLSEVKGVGSLRGDWFATPKPTRDHLYYVLAVVARRAPNRFFVMTQQEVCVAGRGRGRPVEGD
jgi:hypothetical protein